MKKVLFSVMALAVLGLSACKKDKDEDCALTSDSFKGTYKITAMTGQVAGTPAVDVLSGFYEVCELDDLYTFGDNGVFTYTDAGTVCTTPGDETSTWSLSGNELTIHTANPVTISEFKCNHFKLTYTSAGTTFVTTFTRQ